MAGAAAAVGEAAGRIRDELPGVRAVAEREIEEPERVRVAHFAGGFDRRLERRVILAACADYELADAASVVAYALVGLGAKRS